jgi:hypothetical protein
MCAPHPHNVYNFAAIRIMYPLAPPILQLPFATCMDDLTDFDAKSCPGFFRDSLASPSYVTHSLPWRRADTDEDSGQAVEGSTRPAGQPDGAESQGSQNSRRNSRCRVGPLFLFITGRWSVSCGHESVDDVALIFSLYITHSELPLQSLRFLNASH